MEIPGGAGAAKKYLQVSILSPVTALGPKSVMTPGALIFLPGDLVISRGQS